MVGFQSFNTSERDSSLLSSSTTSCASPCRGREEQVELFGGLKEIVFGGLGEGGVRGVEEVEEVVAEVGKFGGRRG